MSISPAGSLKFPCGTEMKNRFMLAPLTNTQSYEDGQLSDEEYNWLTMRAKGQFGIVMTSASHVQQSGKGFPGQLGIFSDELIEGHKKLSAGIKDYGSLAIIQLQHAGMRSSKELLGHAPLCPSDNEETGARALTTSEVEQLRDDFINAAIRSQKSGYDGVEVHGAHGYIITQFLSKEINKRSDQYGGSFENRARLLFEVVDGIRQACGSDFMLGVRLSPEKFGMDLGEIKSLCQKLSSESNIDFLDMSLWDCFKLPDDEKYNSQTLLEHFAQLDLNKVPLTVAGKIKDGKDVQKVLDAGVDFVTIGRSGILHHDFPARVIENPNFTPAKTPVSKEYLYAEGLSDRFIKYLDRFPGFVDQGN